MVIIIIKFLIDVINNDQFINIIIWFDLIIIMNITFNFKINTKY